MNSIVRNLSLAPEFSGKVYRQVMRALPGGVSIVTAGQGSEISGMTVTSLSSLSAEPPRVMVAVNRDASVFPLIQRFGFFGVSILSATQQHLAERFSTKAVTGAARFAGLNSRSLISGVPLLSDASAVIDCQVEEVIERHSHAIVIGQVLEAATLGDRGAIAYRNGDFVKMSPETPGGDFALWAVW